MKTLDEKIDAVQVAFRTMDDATKIVCDETQISCPKGCGKCCDNPNVEATVLEMLPLARELQRIGRADDFYQSATENNETRCVFFDDVPKTGSLGACTVYEFRPTVCRLFGFAGRRNKSGVDEFSFCKVHKETIPALVHQAENLAESRQIKVPLFTESAQLMSDIDPSLSAKTYKINQALCLAIEKIALLAGCRQSF